MSKPIELDLTASSLECANWGPLKVLVGKWIGAREKQITTQNVVQFYEMRTFRRRSVVFDSATSQAVYPVLFSARVFDFYHRNNQISEETGYLLWIPESQRVVQLTVQPTGFCRLECARLQEAGQACCLMLNSQGAEHVVLDAEIGLKQSPVLSIQSTVVFDSSTFRFGQTVVFQDFDQKENTRRETGELMRVAS